MEMRAGDAEAAPAVRTLDGPHRVLRLALVLLHFRVAAVSIVSALLAARAVRRDGSEDRRYIPHPFRETHVIVPLVAGLERVDPARDRMGRQRLVIGLPMRVHGSIGLEIAA